MRTLLGIGAMGEIVRKVQSSVTKAGFDAKGTDGIYGNDTGKAVQAFQSDQSLAATGAVDETTWTALVNAPAPAVGERSLQLTSSFENHGFGLAIGNCDGALLTWGIIGFTMASGEVKEIVLAIHRSAPELVAQAFGAGADSLLSILETSRDEQKAWADSITLPNGMLAEPWRTRFQTFGSFPEVQQEQIRRVQRDYLAPAIRTAKKLGFTSELGLALCFDIQVQNGGIKTAAASQIKEQRRPEMSEAELRTVVANAVADRSKRKWREDVRRRKLTIATGEGVVHGYHYVLENWGLAAEFAAAELEGVAG